MRSLGARWTLALVAVCLLEAVLIIAAVRFSTRRSFDRFVREQAVTSFAEDAAEYYREHGTLDGIDQTFRRRVRRSGPPAEADREPSASGERPRRRDGRRGRERFLRFALADVGGRIVLPAGDYALGDALRDRDGAERFPLVVDGDTVGTILRTAEAQELGQAQQQFLRETQAALWWAVALVLLGAVLLGWLLTRATTRPLRALTRATDAMARGDLEQHVPVRSRDEVGQLAAAFNAMSARVAEAHMLRRRMTADVAHDLRTPLSVLTGYLEALRDGTLAPSPERLAAMHAEAEHLGRLIDDLRTLALADAGELTLHRAAVEPGAILARVAASFAPEAKAHGLVLGLDTPADLPRMDADEDRLLQVLGNLVRNAIRHTPPGGRITLAAEPAPEGIRLTVTDTGEGIPPDVLPYVFERTVRADPSRGGEEGASGLGLAIARSLVEAHGGTIAAESPPGEGTRFTLVLPRVQPQESEPERT